MTTINISQDFTKTPGARIYSDGPYSGQEFYDTMLLGAYQKALKNRERLKVILDGTEGYASSFLNEAFSLLGAEFGPKEVWDNLVIVSNELPKYFKKVKEAVFEARPKKFESLST